ncbi:MAG: TIGR04255 family protein [Verrucomicrobia bacterium]|nr:TIGR04255 family protein [Verrucomicrobiota bacterium]
MEQFKNPPIQEAVIDIQVTLPRDVKLETLTKFHEGVEARFPERQERISWQQGFQISGTGDTHAMRSSRSVDGYLFVSKADGKIVQARRDGFTFNKLRPYSNWETFSAEAKELWERYVALARPSSVQRVALKYLNRIALPLPLHDLREYCLLFPDLPPALPQGMSELFLRVALPVADAP